VNPLTHAVQHAPIAVPAPLQPVVPTLARPVTLQRRNALNEEWLPFSIEVVASEEALAAAVAVRQAAYSRHLPEFSSRLGSPEPADLEPGVTVLLARSKVDGEPLGSMRIQTNTVKALPMEASVELPTRLRESHLAEATRLGVTQAHVGRLVKTALFKAFYLHCVAEEVDFMVVTARPPLDRQYQRLLFDEVFPERGPVPMAHVGNIPHRILTLDVAGADAAWAAAAHPLRDFMVHTSHPDIHVGMARRGRRRA
jgi:hypothetical protein